MHYDICTCQVSLSDPEVLDAWNQMILGFLSHGQTAPVHLGTVLERAPDFAMAHAAKGIFSLLMGRRELVAVAEAANRSAQTALRAGGATRREQIWCAALNDWVRGYPRVAILRMEDALRQNRADTLSMKVSHALRFVLGDNFGMRRSVEAVIGAQGKDHPLHGYALGCLAFALEETGSYREAERTGHMALEFAHDDAWGLHAVAHVYDMTHRPDAGISLIETNGAAWSHCNNFRFHVWWHKALLHLDLGDFAEVLVLYDNRIRDEKTDDYRDFSNASSLLMRLELEGVDVGDRWSELANLAETRADDGCLVFADLHYMLALAGDSRTDAVAQMTARVTRDALGRGDIAEVMKDPGVAAAQGLAAFGEADFDSAFAKLRVAQPHFQRMGGSHAQRDVFERLTIEAGIRAGRLDETDALIAGRTRLRGGLPDSFAEGRMEMIAAARAQQAIVAAE
ncbi:MAG: tetratricopeptide repeat protein [Pseudomonadota bacterium]